MLNNEGDDEHRDGEEFNHRLPSSNLNAEGEYKTLQPVVDY